MPFELDPLLEEFVLEPPPEEAPDAWLDWVLEGVDDPELEEFDPQAATPRVTRTSRAVVSRRGDLIIGVFIMLLSFRARKSSSTT